MTILIIGPLPEPINGCSYANEILCKRFELEGIQFNTVNTNTPFISSHQGTSFSFRKAFAFLNTYWQCFKIFGAKSVYMTPGQTFFGLAKYAPFILLCIALRKPYVIHVHGNFLGKEYIQLSGAKARFFKFLISHCSAGIVLSENLREIFHALLPENKIFVVENFVDDLLLQSYSEQAKPNDMLRVLYLSNLMEEKGILDLLDALLLLKQKKIDFHAQFAGKIESSIESMVNEKIQLLGNQVEYIGIVKGFQKQKAFNKNNVFVLPTYYQMEGQPISILEALGTGNIIVTTVHAGIPDIITTHNGYFVESKNPESITKSLELISKDLNNQIKQFSYYNASYAKKRFTEQSFSSKIIKIIETVKQK